MKVLLDTNILGRFSQPAHLQNSATVGAIQQLGDAGFSLRLVPQVIYEYWTMATRPSRDNGLGFSAIEVRKNVDAFIALFPLMRDERGIFEPWLTLVSEHSCLGKPAHDARLVAAMQRHGLTHILTFNIVDFRRFPDIEVLHPEALPPMIATTS